MCTERPLSNFFLYVVLACGFNAELAELTLAALSTGYSSQRMDLLPVLTILDSCFGFADGFQQFLDPANESAQMVKLHPSELNFGVEQVIHRLP